MSESAVLQHEYVTLNLEAGGGAARRYGVFPVPAGIDLAPPESDEAMPGPTPADLNPRVFLPEGAKPYHARGLRVALAMKGGVSLAVWIGGAIAELDILRRIRVYRDGDDPRPKALLIHPNGRPADEHLLERADAYARLLCSRGYDRVEYDVLAGASAGGLNGVMYAVAQRAGVGLEGILGTWLSTGSAWGLIQTGRPAAYDSVLRGDEYFWVELEQALGEIATGTVSPGNPGEAPAQVNPPHPALAAPHVVVDLSATLIDAKDTNERSAAEGRAHFRFVGTDDDPVPDRGIPGLPRAPGVPGHVTEARRKRDFARLAYAARATSSFPGAFEPALIYSDEEPLVGPEVVASPPDMRNVFSAHRERGRIHPFRVVDGGVLDNIPIDRALRAVRNIPANEHVNRALVYLDPSPKETSHWLIRATKYDGPGPELSPDSATTRSDPLSRFLTTILTAVRKRSGAESSEDEIDAVDAARTAALVAKGRDEMLAVRLDPRPVSTDGPVQLTAAAAFARLRSTTDAELLRAVFTRPGEWTLGTNLVERPARTALDRISIGRFEKALRAVLDDLSRGVLPDGVPADAISGGSQTLVDASFCALTWIRALEDQSFRTVSLHGFDRALEQDPATSAHSRAVIRERLYAVMSEARDLRDLAVEQTLDVVDTIPRVEGTLSEERARRLALIWLTANARTPARRRALWAELDDIVRWLQDASSALAGLPTQAEWLESPWHLLPASSVPLPASDLPLIFAGSGMPTAMSTVRFHRIGSDTQPAAPTKYRTLLDAQLLEGYRAALAKPAEELDGGTVTKLLDDAELRSSSKLAGLRIANFAGFLSAAWRRNDWWWGRLDASAGMLELLGSMERAPKVPGNSLPEAVAVGEELRVVHDALLVELNADDARPYEHRVEPADPDAIRAEMVRGTQDLESLGSGYRVALASRVVRAASTALVRGSGTLSPTRVLQLLIRPLLVLAPALLSPPRLILSLVIIVCGVLLAWPELEDPAPIGWPTAGRWVMFAVVAAFVAFRLTTAAIAWRRHWLVVANHTEEPSRARQVIATAERRARTLRFTLVGITIALFAVFIAATLAYGLWGAPFWIALVALLSVTEVTSRAMQTVPSARRSRPARWVALGVLSVIAIATTAVLPTALDGLTAGIPAPWNDVAWRSIAAAIVVAALSITLLAQALRTPHLLGVVAITVVTTVAAVVATTLALGGSTTATQTWVGFVVSAWVAGTTIWWAPWFRGWDTGPAGMPKDSVYDLEPGSLVGDRRASRSRAGRSADGVAETDPPLGHERLA